MEASLSAKVSAAGIANPKFSAVVAVGPGERELLRLDDLIVGLSIFESDHLHELLIVDDSNGRHDFTAVTGEAGIHVRVVKSPRQGRGDGWRGGLVTSVLFGLKEVFRCPGLDFVLKVDTDTLIISPVAERVRDRFHRDADIGMLGSYFKRNLRGEAIGPSTWRVNLEKWARMVRLRRNPIPHLEFSLFGRNKTIRRLLNRSLRNGWPMGACAQGGGYAVRRELYDRFQADEYLSDDLLWLHTDLGEDIVMALLCYAAGMGIADCNGPGEVFGVKYEGLGYPVQELFDLSYAVVHSVKTTDWASECQLRNSFREKITDPQH